MRNYLLRSICSLLVLVVLYLAPQSAHACSCLPVPRPETARGEADVVFAGKVLGSQVELLGIFSGKWLKQEVLFEVTKTWKGLSKSQAITIITSNKCCGWTPLSFGSGEEFLVYAQANAHGRFETSYWEGTQPLNEASSFLTDLGTGEDPSEAVEMMAGFFLPRYLFGAAVLALGVLAAVRVYRQNKNTPS